jgi:3-hydroxyisobutyrate dehydrogenase
MSKPRVAILGLGTMGSGMAGRLLSHDFSVSIFNRNQEKAWAFAARGATLANSPREAAMGSDFVISMVSDDRASRDVWLGKDGALASASAGTLLIESSTLTVSWVKELAAAAAASGCELLDAPVTGSKPHAESGELLFLVGGSNTAFETAKPVFSVLGRGAIHLGPTGSGALLKLINNFLAAVQTVSFAEALALVDAGGLDREKVISILTEGVPGSPMLKRAAARVASGDFTPHFLMRLMAKDVSYALLEAGHFSLQLPTAAAALAEFEQAIEDGHGDEDFTAVARSRARTATEQRRTIEGVSR